MRRLRYLAGGLIMVLLFASLTGCAGTSPDKLMSKPSKTELQKQALEKIDQDIPKGAIKEVRQIALSGQEPAEHVVIYKVPFKDGAGGTPELGGIIVEQYNAEEKQWNKAWEGQWECLDLQFMGNGKLMGDDRNQVAIGAWSGNGGYFEFVLLGMQDNKIEPLINQIGNDSGIPSGNMKFENGGITVQSGTQGTFYKWNGEKFATSAVVVLPDMTDKKDSDLELHYSFDENEQGTLKDSANKEITLKVGQKLYLVRDNANGIWERIMGTGEEPAIESIAWGVFEAKHSGTSEITIIPNGYDWEKALTIEVVVSD